MECNHRSRCTTSSIETALPSGTTHFLPHVPPTTTKSPFSRVDNRYSMGSSSETYFSGNTEGFLSSRHSQQPIIQPGTPDRDSSASSLPPPAPFGPNYRDSSPSSSSNGLGRGVDDEGLTPPGEVNPRQRLIPTADYSPYAPGDESEPIYSRTQPNSPAAGPGYPAEGRNPFRAATQPHAPAYEPNYPGYTQEPEELPQQVQAPSPTRRHQRGQSRGFSLVDPGVVPTGESVRRVARKRPTSTAPTAPPTTGRRQSRSSGSPSAPLPPGAAAPQYPRYG